MADAKRVVVTSPRRLWAGVAMVLAGTIVLFVGSWPTASDVSPAAWVITTALNIAGVLTIISSRGKIPDDIPVDPQH